MPQAEPLPYKNYLDQADMDYLSKLDDVGIADVRDIIERLAEEAFTAGYEQAVEDGTSDD